MDKRHRHQGSTDTTAGRGLWSWWKRRYYYGQYRARITEDAYSLIPPSEGNPEKQSSLAVWTGQPPAVTPSTLDEKLPFWNDELDCMESSGVDKDSSGIPDCRNSDLSNGDDVELKVGDNFLAETDTPVDIGTSTVKGSLGSPSFLPNVLYQANSFDDSIESLDSLVESYWDPEEEDASTIISSAVQRRDAFLEHIEFLAVRTQPRQVQVVYDG